MANALDDRRLSLVSLNVFGIPFFLSWRRLQSLASRIDRLGPDVICLQEVQQNAYTGLLARSLPHHPHRATFPHVYAPKGGLETHSRMPFLQTRFVLYKDRGLRYVITFSDWGLYKGVLVCQLQVGNLPVFVLNTHLNANYIGIWSLANPLTRMQQRQIETIATVLDGLRGDALVILCGDFNFPRSAFLYEELICRNGLVDPLRDDPRPTYRPFPFVPSGWNVSLDYLLLRLPSGREFSVKPDIQALDNEVVSSGGGKFLTDHCLLSVDLRWGM